ncbi:PLP-dependent aspartate aminotransferase family protein [Conexibacter sp. CPCC 206217]|uniref:trans-sulfuration enzyme family protein n=1 Tax=Conexibacter sp. CPCC 206217 TaxID=3064574 RepID=UPI002724DCDC|nr:PLP-dependent transferase [Conexibacter sp. CPCC 206217]MDO8212626.1 PLP-dependent transferase [Conexibacter sp. CPCC 206217]
MNERPPQRIATTAVHGARASATLASATRASGAHASDPRASDLRAGGPPPVRSTVVGPVHHGATFPLDDAALDDVAATGGRNTWYYSRLANPTVARVAGVVAALEGAPAAELFASGMAAIDTVLTALVAPGGHLVAAADLYGDTVGLLAGEWAAAGRRVSWVDVGDHAGFERALQGGADAIYVEALSNPMLRVADLTALAQIAHRAGALAIVDATFASPVNVRPYEHGFDVVVHSATKYLNGHSDLIAGAVAGSEQALARVRPLAALRGATLDPGAAFLLERGLKTLAVRMERHNANGLAVATWLDGHDAVASVAYPLLADHPDRALAIQQLTGASGIVTVTLAGDAGRARRLVGALRLIEHAASLGGVESLACLPRFTSHVTLDAAELDRQGIGPTTIRLSLGIEDADDLIADLDQALAA